MQTLSVVNTGQGFVLQADRADAGTWAAVFGLLAYGPGWVSLSNTWLGPWMASQVAAASHE